jgi:dienelactone hydrolase
MQSQLYVNEAGPARRPGVLVFPEAFGLGAHAKAQAERLAGLGYAALSCDLHGGGTVHESFETIGALLGALGAAPERIRARARGGLEALLARPEVDPARIAAIGYCFGGTMALELARDGAALAGTVGFHSGLGTAAPAVEGAVKGKVLVCIGADDPTVGADQRAAFEAEMRGAKADWQMHIYGGVVHSFTNEEADARGMPDFVRYDGKADARSWAAMLGLFGEIFGAAG